MAVVSGSLRSRCIAGCLGRRRRWGPLYGMLCVGLARRGRRGAQTKRSSRSRPGKLARWRCEAGGVPGHLAPPSLGASSTCAWACSTRRLAEQRASSPYGSRKPLRRSAFARRWLSRSSAFWTASTSPWAAGCLQFIRRYGSAPALTLRSRCAARSLARWGSRRARLLVTPPRRSRRTSRTWPRSLVTPRGRFFLKPARRYVYRALAS